MSKKMTTLDVARLAGVTNNAVCAAIARGELSAERFGRRMFEVDEDSAMEYVARVLKHKPGPAGHGVRRGLTVTLPEETMNKFLRMVEEHNVSRAQVVEKMILAMEKMEAIING